MKKFIKPEILVPLIIVIGILGFILIGGTMNKGVSNGDHGHSHGDESHSH